jgi:hypothetical protein
MAALAHLGVGLAAKRIAPTVPLWALIVAAYAIDIVWGLCFLARLETYPTQGAAAPCPWSHGLFMSLLWSTLAGLVAARLFRHRRTGIIIALLVFSHWIVDFLVKPMLAAFPTDVGVPLLFNGSPVVGLGLYSTTLGQNIGEYGMVVVGIGIYLFVIWRNRQIKDEK